MSRQRVDPGKVDALLRYHSRLRELFKEGKLNGKITHLLKVKAKEMGIGLATYFRRKATKNPAG